MSSLLCCEVSVYILSWPISYCHPVIWKFAVMSSVVGWSTRFDCEQAQQEAQGKRQAQKSDDRTLVPSGHARLDPHHTLNNSAVSAGYSTVAYNISLLQAANSSASILWCHVTKRQTKWRLPRCSQILDLPLFQWMTWLVDWLTRKCRFVFNCLLAKTVPFNVFNLFKVWNTLSIDIPHLLSV